MKLILTLILIVVVLVFPAYTQKQRMTFDVSLEKIEAVVRNGYGFKVRVESQASEPFYLLGDFNGDGFADIAILVNIEAARADLKNHRVKYVNIDAYSSQNGFQIDPLSHDSSNCLGIAIVHGAASGWESTNPAGRFMVYECFSSFRVIRKGQRIRRGSGSRGRTPIPTGDSIFLELETGGTALVYWNGKTYRGFGVREGC